MAGVVRPAKSPALLERLRREPTAGGLRVEAALALEREGQAADAVQLLVERWTNVTAHEGPPLPCLCRRCLDPALATVTTQGGVFRRAFSATDGRVLFYWVPADLPVSPGLRGAVRAALHERLTRRRPGTT